MPTAVMHEWGQEFDVPTYKRIAEKLDLAKNPPDGLIVHTAGEVDGRMRIFDVWESSEKFDRFLSEKVMPAVQEVVGQPAPPKETRYQLVNLVKP